MQAFASTDRVRPGARVARISAIASIGGVATILGASVIVALLVGWIVAASLGLGTDGHPGVGPDRPPPPELMLASLGR